MKNIPYQPLLLFDGICNLCNTSINYIIKRDKRQLFKFASLQSDAAKQVLLQFNEKKYSIDSIILIYNNSIYYKSSAILKLFSIMGGIYSLSAIGYIIPKKLRDKLYDYIATNRYKWFGKRESCMLPTTDLEQRFID